MSSLRTRRASQFPPQQATSAFQRNLDAVPEIPEIPVHHIPSSSLNPSSIPSAGYAAPRPGGGTKRTPSYVRRADVVREAEGRDKRRMSRVGEKIRKRLSLRYNDPLPPADTPPVPSGSSSALGTPQKGTSSQFGVGDVIPATSYSRLALPGADAVDALNDKFSSYSLASGVDGLKGSKAYARRTSRFDSGPSFVSRPSAGTGFTGIEEEDEEPEVAVIRQAGEQQQWDLEPLQDPHVDLNACRIPSKGAEEDEVESFKQALQRRKAENAEQLKRNVFQNYGDFVTVSKEISTLENEMLELKDLISEWKTVPELLNNGVDPTTDPGIVTSSSLNNLAAPQNGPQLDS
ncbi:hypothetical protein QFC20_003557 [Naganishia adeliensis]|uniref:Uncharacterized protein n=1 Tax=Naganishia adeliensis TaxID=92952 RepID=A0ACC2WAJ9_9TREE|nr:hypothetical protein QFC20_003557 [Naganishia adeliensis]